MLTHQPRAKGKLSHETEEFLEDFLLWALEQRPLNESTENDAFWECLKLADPATAKRLIARGLQLCADRGEKLPPRLAEAAISRLVKPTARNRIHNREQMLKAAGYQAGHPGASLREIAKAADVDHTLIRQWKSQFAYKSEVIKQLVPYARRTYEKYVDRFGSPFADAGLPEPDARGLNRLRTKFAEAISKDIPITDLEILKAALRPPILQ